MDRPALRRVSSALFGNEKTVEVVRALKESSNTATAQQLSKKTGIDHPMVRIVLLRLRDAGVLTALPRGHARAAQYYEADPADPAWIHLCSLADAVIHKCRRDQHDTPIFGPR